MARPQTLQAAMPGIWRMIRRFWPYLRAERRVIGISALLLLAEIALRVLEPWPLKLVFDRVLSPVAGRATVGTRWLDAVSPAATLGLAAAGVVVIALLRASAEYSNTIGFSLVGNHVLTAVRGDLYRHLQRLSLSFHTKARSGDLVVRVIGDVDMLKEVTVSALLPMVTNTLTLVGMLVFMVWIEWRLALLALVITPLFLITTARTSTRIQDVARRQRRREGAMAATATESIAAIKIVQALSLESTFDRDFSSRSARTQREEMQGRRLSAGLERTVDVLIALATALVLWTGARLVVARALTPGELLVFLAYLKNAFKPMRDFAKYTGRLAKASAAGERVLDLLDRAPDVEDAPGAVAAPALRGALRFDDVTFAYEPGRPVLETLSFDVDAGQRIALIGPSGIGKSTVLSLIMRLYDPGRGRVLIDGRDIRDFTLASLRAQTSVVMQDNILFAASVWDNVAYGRPEATRDEIEAVCRLANAHEFINALPDGYDTVLGERGATLSHGQRQRIAIARAAIRKAPILILDEPTTGLDEGNGRAVIEALERLSRGRTTVMVTHDLSLAGRADVIAFLDGGRIAEFGSHTDLLRAGAKYAAWYRAHALTHGRPDPAGDGARTVDALVR